RHGRHLDRARDRFFGATPIDLRRIEVTDWKAFLDGYHQGRVHTALDVLCESIVQGDVEGAEERLKTAIKISRQACAVALPILNEDPPMATFKMGRTRPAPYRKLHFASYMRSEER